MEGEKAVHARDSFHLEIDGISSGSFLRCSGLAARVDVLEYSEGGSERPRKLRGDLSYPNICLERGVVRDQDLYNWFLKGDLRDGAVILLSREGREVVRWSFQRGWPCRWEGPALDARETGVALELLEGRGGGEGRWRMARETGVALELLEIAHEGVQCLPR